jgi:hypothetical protein
MSNPTGSTDYNKLADVVVAAEFVAELDANTEKTVRVDNIQNCPTTRPFLVLFDSTATHTLINMHSLPIGCLPESIDDNITVATTLGRFKSSQQVCLDTLTFLDLRPDNHIHGTPVLLIQCKGHVFSKKCKYDMIIGRDICNMLEVKTSHSRANQSDSSLDGTITPGDNDIVFPRPGAKTYKGHISDARQDVLCYSTYILDGIKHLEATKRIAKCRRLELLSIALAKYQSEKGFRFWSCVQNYKSDFVFTEIRGTDAARRIQCILNAKPHAMSSSISDPSK